MKKVLIYCRESRDDNCENYERIETQANMLKDYVKKENLGEIYKTIIDDNKTGIDFKRLEPIKEMIINKEFEIFLCKDCSRIGRNLLESLKFIEFLEEHNIELMFLSEIYDEDIFPIKAWFNQLRVKDDSKKIKNVLHQKKKDGSLLIKAPYGYNKVNNMLIINEETSEVVIKIFNMFTDGFSKKYICKYLNDENIKTPSMYKSEYNKALIWSPQQIDRILKNQVYVGDMIYDRKVKKSYKSKTYVNNEKENFIIISNHHKGIISIDVFNNAQKLINSQKSQKKIYSTNIFSGIIYCKDCNSPMIRKTRGNYPPYYICKKYNAHGNRECTSKKITEQELLLLTKKQILSILKNETNYTLIKDFLSTYEENDNKKSYLLKLKKLKTKLSLLYEDKQMIPSYLFEEKFYQYTDEINVIEEKLNSLCNKSIEIDKLIEQCNNIQLTNEHIKVLFDKIYIG